MPSSQKQIDSLTDPSQWQLTTSDGASASVHTDGQGDSRCTRLDYAFEGAGFIGIRRRVSIDLPENYCFTFNVKGHGLPNNLELKFLDESGENVFWSRWLHHTLPSDWQAMRAKRRHISYAWGPSREPLKKVAFIEFCLATSAGGKGSLYLGDLGFTELPLSQDIAGSKPDITVSSGNKNAAALVGAEGATGKSPLWSSTRAKRQYIDIAYDSVKEIGGLLIDWDSEDYASTFHVQIPVAGKEGSSSVWKTLNSNDSCRGNRSFVYLPEVDTQVVRLLMVQSSRGRGYKIRHLAVQPVEFSQTVNQFWSTVAASAPRGHYPQNLDNKMTYWTVVSRPKAAHKALMSEHGSVEVDKLGFTLEPFIRMTGSSETDASASSASADASGSAAPAAADSSKVELLGWAQARFEHSLEEGYMPIPSVERFYDKVALKVTAWEGGTDTQPLTYVRYRVKNTSAQAIRGPLFVAVRPFQVNPPWQFLNQPGGFSPIKSLAIAGSVTGRDGGAVRVNDDYEIVSPGNAFHFYATTLDGGDISAFLANGTMPSTYQASDQLGFASGALRFDLDVAPGAEQTFDVIVRRLAASATGSGMPSALWGKGEAAGSFAKGAGSNGSRGNNAKSARGKNAAKAARNADRPRKYDLIAAPDKALATAKNQWQRTLASVKIDLEGPAAELGATMKAQIAYILANANGSAFQPGARCYARTWIRDSSLTGSALLQWGFASEVADFLRWFAPYQFDSGKVPCCVDHRGADAVPEHDSPGEFIFLVTEYYRYTGDKALVKELMPHVIKAVDYIDSLRAQRLTPEYDAPNMVHLRGLLPESISHEGYSDKPAHSYWDDFWCLRGLSDAVFLANELYGDGGPVAKDGADMSANGAESSVGVESSVKERIAASAKTFRHDLMDSIHAAMRFHKLDFIPGAACRGDIDPTSTTIALDPVGATAEIESELEQTFERYYRFFIERRDGRLEWGGYTPYEWRCVGSFVRLGKRERAHEMLNWFMNHRRPAGFRHWAEVVHNDTLLPKFIGDAPHTWVGSDFLRSARSLFVYEREEDHALVLLAGVTKEWLDAGFELPSLATRFGKLALSVTRSGGDVIVNIDGKVNAKVVVARIPVGFAGMAINRSSDSSTMVDDRGEFEITLPAKLHLITSLGDPLL